MDAYVIVAADFVKTGGMDRANLEFASYVASRGHETYLVAHRVSADLARLPRVYIHRVPRLLGVGILGERALDIAGQALVSRLPATTRVVVNGGNCAVNAVNWVHYVHRSHEATAAAQALRSHAFRLVAQWSERRAITKARLVIANSEKTRGDLLLAYDLSSVPVHAVHCGLDPSSFFPVNAEERVRRATSLGLRPERRRLAFVGALGSERKGFAVLFEALQAALPDWGDVEAVVVGAGRLLPAWQRKAADAGLTDRLRFLGQRPDVAEILQASDLLVAPSRYESYGLNIAEALATGLPVVASKTSGASSLVTGSLRELLLEDPQSSLELLEKLRIWQAHERDYRQAALAKSESVRRHDWAAMSTAIYSLVEGAYSS